MCGQKGIGVVLTLIIAFTFGISSFAYAATYQEMLDAGLVELTSNASLTLRAGETYYISIRGGQGGGGGSSIRFDQRDGSVSYTGGGGASRGGVTYYSVEVASDTVINLYVGGRGYSGRDCNYQFKNPPEWGSVSGGSGGGNALGIGNGSPGGDGESYYSWSDTKAGRLYYGAGAGGGGGAASIITFGGNNNNRISAPGGTVGRQIIYTFIIMTVKADTTPTHLMAKAAREEAQVKILQTSQGLQ